jgi:hypothetical protein
MNVRCVGTKGSGQAVGEGCPNKRAPQAMAAVAGARPRARVWVGWAAPRQVGCDAAQARRGGGEPLGRDTRWVGGRKGAWATRRGRGRGPVTQGGVGQRRRVGAGPRAG